MADLIINGKNALATWGIRMGEGFLDVIGGLSPLKEFIENKSRMENGKRVLIVNPKLNERDITLTFTLEGKSKTDYLTKKKSFFEELYKGEINIQVPMNGNEIYHLIYTGKSVSYAQNIAQTFGKISCKFNEPNPANRV